MGTPCLCLGKIDGICQRQQGPPFVRGRDCGIAYHWHNRPETRVHFASVGIKTTDNKKQIISRTKNPCIYLGERLSGQPCGSTLHPCGFYGDVTAKMGVCKDADRTCIGCNDYNNGTPKADAWYTGSGEFLRTLPPYPAGKWSGKGIVICGGGPYWPSVYVTVRMLRHVGCALPIQVWCFKNEWNRRYGELLSEYGVDFVDVDNHPARSARRMVHSFGIKLFAAVNSPFDEVLSLDADNYPCQNLETLFEDHRYVERGGIYWPDRTHTNSWTKWPFWGVEEFGPKCGFETGQFLLHKRKAYEPMMLAEWYDDHGDVCYATNNSGVLSGGGDYGDKGPHRVAWARLRREPVVFNTTDAWKECAFLQVGPDGQTPMFIHRCQGKFVLDKLVFPTTPQISVNQRYGFPMEDIAFGYLNELRERLS